MKTFTNSGMSAPASVPQLITVASFHQRVLSPAKCWNDQVRNEVCQRDSDYRGQTKKIGERDFEIHLVPMLHISFSCKHAFTR